MRLYAHLKVSDLLTRPHRLKQLPKSGFRPFVLPEAPVIRFIVGRGYLALLPTDSSQLIKLSCLESQRWPLFQPLVCGPSENARCSKGDLRFLSPLIILERQFAYHPLRVLLVVLQ